MNTFNTNDERSEKTDHTTIEAVRFEPLNTGTTGKTITFRRNVILIFVSLLLCVLIASFLFIARSVFIEITPSDAQVKVNTLLQLKLADRHLLLRGEHNLKAQAKGYYPLEESIQVGGEQNQHFPFTLQRLPGHLQLDTAELSGAEIFIDGDSKGFSPALIKNISPGEHTLRIVADRYFTHEQNLEIEGLDKEQSLSVTMQPAWADISFKSQPASADILIDDQLVGQTPFTASVLEGERSVKIKLPGYKLWKDNLKVVASEHQSLPEIKLEPADALLFIVSNPPRANSTVDGEFAGLTPLEVAITPDKKTKVRLFKQGYEAVEKEITVASGEEQRLVLNLPPELVEVNFTTSPDGAKLFINGKSRGDANQTLRLPAKTHRYEVRKDGYLTFSSKITSHSGIPQQVKISLKSELQAKQEKIKPVYKNSAGQTLKLFYPGKFTMGASRRERGRRANETMRPVELERPFYLATHEVTNAQYKKFSASHSSGSVQGFSLDGDSLPVAKVSWEQAALFCNWLSRKENLSEFYVEENNKISGFHKKASGYRLPSEAEWAWAARYIAENRLLKFPWGEQMPPPEKSGNFADTTSGAFLGKIIPNYTDGFAAASPVGSFAANSRGLYDMGGNVAEWVNDYYDIQLGAPSKAEVDPLGPGTGKFHVIRGSSWAHGTHTELRLSYRDYNEKARDDVGFRIARYLE